MNNNIKLNVSIVLPGRTAHITGTQKVVTLFRKNDLIPNYKGKDGNKIIKKKVARIPIIEYAECKKNIKFTQDAYDYMTSDATPEWYNQKDWKRLSKKARLEQHLIRTMQHENGTSFTYSILED